MNIKLENFERAFSSGTGGCVRTCNCGVRFYDNDGSYDWEEGELDGLRADPTARALEHTVGDISFEGKEYVDACDCWHERALKLMDWIDGHAYKVADYLTLEKKRKQEEADRSPVVQ